MSDKKKKKEYVEPVADLLVFTDEDIISVSSGGTLSWGDDDNTEEF